MIRTTKSCGLWPPFSPDRGHVGKAMFCFAHKVESLSLRQKNIEAALHCAAFLVALSTKWYNTLMDESQNTWQAADEYYAPQSPTLDPIEWTASEFISHQKTGKWYVSLGALSACATLIVFLVTKNIFSAFVVAAACMALGVLAARQPQTKRYIVSADGVTIGDTPYPYSMFKSFSVIDDDAIRCIWLRPLKRFMPTVVMYYPPDQEERILLMLENFLPIEDRQHDFVDRLSRRIRF